MDDAQLSETARAIIADEENEIYFSAASAWEISIKAARERLTLPQEPEIYIPSRLNLHNFKPLPVEVHHAVKVYSLPKHHMDPFDRLLIAQSQIESMPLLSVDAEIRKYDVDVIW